MGRWVQTLPFKIASVHGVILVLAGIAVFAILDPLLARYLVDQVDHNLETQALLIASEVELSGLEEYPHQVKQKLDLYARSNGVGESFFRILDQGQRPLVITDLTHWPLVPLHDPPWSRIEHHPFVVETVSFGDHRARLIYYRYPQNYTLQIGFSLRNVERMRNHGRLAFGGAILAMILVVSALSTLTTWRALAGVALVRRAATAIRNKRDLRTPIPLPTGSLETDELARTFNQMLTKIADLLRDLQRITDNVAHDIRTPVTRMRGLAEAELRQKKSDPAVLALAGNVVQDCDHILHLVNILLDIAVFESDSRESPREPFDLAELVSEGCDLFQPLLEDKNQRLVADLPPSLRMLGDQGMFQRIVTNLLDNAVKYSPEESTIEVHLDTRRDWAHLTVRDHGSGIPPESLQQIFKPFFRGDQSRSQPGNGLGLSYCAAAMKSIGGRITANNHEAGGARFELQIPLPQKSKKQTG